MQNRAFLLEVGLLKEKINLKKERKHFIVPMDFKKKETKENHSLG